MDKIITNKFKSNNQRRAVIKTINFNGLIAKNLSFPLKTTVFSLFVVLLIYVVAEEKLNITSKNSNISVPNSVFSFEVVEGAKLSKVVRKLNLRKIPGIRSIKRDRFPQSLEGKLEWKLSVILNRVKNLLNMYPKRLKHIKIKIHPNMKKMKRILKMITTHKASSFYSSKTNTIHISAKKCDEYIIAHELAHVVIANYFVVKAPAHTQEILAMYCDSHLKDQSVYIAERTTRK